MPQFFVLFGVDRNQRAAHGAATLNTHWQPSWQPGWQPGLKRVRSTLGPSLLASQLKVRKSDISIDPFEGVVHRPPNAMHAMCSAS
jgi:hypothetical protein